MTDAIHWADQTAKKILKENESQEQITCAAGITPSGIVHIGNFREIMTVDLIVRALKRVSDKKIRFLYSWDDYDVFRKVPANMPNQDMLKEHLRKAIVDVPDPFGEHESYARHHEIQIENVVSKLGIKPEFLYQAKKYRNAEYTQGIKKALENTQKIREILDQFRKEPLADDYLPASIFCDSCKKDTISKLEYKGDTNLFYECACGHSETFDFATKPIAKLAWRTDWPMRWAHEKVHFEPGGKDHSSQGGSFDTAKDIVKLFSWKAPLYVMYDFIRIKGGAGKISSSSGDVITTQSVLDIYEPEMVRWLYAGNRVGSEFAISFDLDVIKLYEDFDKCERIYYGKDKASTEKEEAHLKRVYELSAIESVPKEMPYQPAFRHLTTIVQIYEHDLDKIENHYKEHEGVSDTTRVRIRALCASNWLKQYAPDTVTFTVKETNDYKASESVKPAIQKVLSLLEESNDPDDIGTKAYQFCKENEINPKDFFTQCYQILIGKDKGPKLTHFMLIIGKERTKKLLESAI